MDYKKMIIELLEKVKNEYTLKRVYRLLEYLYLKEESGGEYPKVCVNLQTDVR